MISLALAFVLPLILQADTGCFEDQYVADATFANNVSFANVTDIAVDTVRKLVFVLQRSHPPVTVWSTNGTFRFAWNTLLIGYPHYITLRVADTTVWITDMAGELAAGESYGHCVKEFKYSGEYIRSIGKCGKNTSGSSLDPPQFDKVTDIAFSSNGHCYITDGDIGGLNNRVLVFDSSFRLVDVWNKDNKPGSGPLQFNLPHRIVIDVCDRVWIVDTLNHRLQIVSENGTFLGEWSCFGNALIYGMDIDYGGKSSSIILTAVTDYGGSEILFLPFNTDCAQKSNFGECTIQRRLALKQSSTTGQYGNKVQTSKMLHSVAYDNITGSLYVSELPGSTPPKKFHIVPKPPANNASKCSAGDGPPFWQAQWSATALLTPFYASDLKTAKLEYSSTLKAMYIALQGPDGITEEYLNIGNKTYILQTNSTTISCLGPYNYGWVTPQKAWLDLQKCKCEGSLNIAGVPTMAWRCVMDQFSDWIWFKEGTSHTYRMFFNNQSNPHHLPVLGNFTFVNFASYGNDISNLKKALENCMKGNSIRHDKRISVDLPAVEGFSYNKCSEITHLPSWPEHFYMTVTMLPVLRNSGNPFPTAVVYDWQEQSQHTTLCEPHKTYNAYLIHNKTYIVEQSLTNGTVKCHYPLNFGPPVPDWMTKDNCKCMGTITDNPALSPWHFTALTVCPIEEKRVFWAWFTTDRGYSPLLFLETLTPPEEGTGLALADYHEFYSSDILIETHDFEVPSKCKGK